uniref:hypothetical protein n=1 Tax=Ignavigranum ruoffiae TaxID=89093 RepID=UPI0024ADA5BE
MEFNVKNYRNPDCLIFDRNSQTDKTLNLNTQAFDYIDVLDEEIEDYYSFFLMMKQDKRLDFY